MVLSKGLGMALAAASLALFTPTVASGINNHPHSFIHTQHHRRQSVPTTLPGNWTSQGCFTDNPGARSLSSAAFTSTDSMTVEACISFCDASSFIFAGVEFGQECYCGNFIGNGGTNTSLAECNTPCTGNAKESCGAGSRLNVFWSGKQPPPPPTIVPKVGNWSTLGCVLEADGARTLTTALGATDDMTVETCTDSCFHAGFPLAGIEFARECYCGLAFANGGGASAPAGDCNMVCTGNSSEFCGGPNRLTAYNLTDRADLPPPQAPGGGPAPGGTPVFPVTSGLPGTWHYSGCFVDNAHGRIFGFEAPVNVNLTVEGCINTCDGMGLSVAGMEFSQECYCGKTLINGAVPGDESSCNMGCGGNATEACGGPNRLSVYTSNDTVVALPVPVIKDTGLPGQWKSAGCLKEPGAERVFPYQIIMQTNLTVEACLNQCAAFGYPAAGMEFSDECYCGDVADEQNNGGVTAPDADCSMPCSGDPIHLCGGAERLQLYHWDGNLDVWHTPANIGRYEFLGTLSHHYGVDAFSLTVVPFFSVVVPLIATVGINNKVTFLEKTGTGFPNSTGAYELDLTLVNDFSAAWRELHVQTDVFCSGSIVLPDKAGRQINVGGWSLDSTFGIRFYTPSGSDGVNGTTDWEENFHELELQRGRWYPTAAMLSNGSILVIGGETGSNASPQPNLEILPKPAGGDTVVELDWLQRTDPNNLYPFVFVLPSGNIFVGYYNEARILEPVGFQTIKELPNIPASVNNFLGGRTYPLEGAAVLFPQHAPYTDPLRVLICGGSNIGAGQAIDNCVSMAPEDPNPTWTLERMPSRRVMPCIAPLPDGTFLILNGAHQGVAGFGLATDPNLSALLYDPSQPVHQRISILNNTIVARLYHSEAILLPDGRVLISGSDPQTPGFPEEFRVEVYIPPYLNQGFRQPEFNITNTDWAYGATATINVKLFQGTTRNMRVSLVAAVSSTHGNTMGSRTIFPAFSCNGNACTITAPPNSRVSPPGWHQLFILDGPTPSHSHWVRIGGDPAQLGNWPQLPGFTPPGV
ncbi:hypothetical protein EYR38_009997 [Pleurotus pulmonarius]|nr:hypothetical protein EYR38_009997 [Pleurotus pulmonarius]